MLRGVTGDGDQVGARDGPQGGGDEHGADRASSAFGPDEVCSGVAGLQVGRGAGPVHQQEQQQQRDAVDGGGGYHPGTADRTGGVPGGQPGAAPEPLREPADHERGAGGAGGEQGGGQPGQAAGAEHVRGEQCPDGDAGGEPGAAEHLRRHDDGERSAVQGVAGDR